VAGIADRVGTADPIGFERPDTAGLKACTTTIPKQA
jgi:hypothetical protein